MKWAMEVEEIEAVLEKIWDLHDKLSDAIHSISRAHFLSSVKSHNLKSNNADAFRHPMKKSPDANGFVYFKDFTAGSDADDSAAIQEAKSLNSIRTALENLEDQLEFFHTIQTHQRAERDAAIARLEQSRIVLAMRLAEHQGKKCKVIEEARALVGEVRNASCFLSPENTSDVSPSGKKVSEQEGKGSNVFVKALVSSVTFVGRFLKLDHVGGVIGNSALVAISMLALLHLNQVGMKEKYILELPPSAEVVYNRDVTKISQHQGSSRSRPSQLDVLLARG
ncbi:OLC1v1027584C1 [Oldenlandia corymbosa var. corymbosa]|uniref:OLC1v1027584C1 n=1 Tax=Oldenlandia corymbosa var. corymbosa TaxID=529605 RepID=A0AAV1CC31_OLDCO|nr:OLC1v1027584C1 [Oldenlandia corymbosa var. corymbosa]